MALGPHKHGRQRELFDRAAVPSFTPSIEAFERQDWRRQARTKAPAFGWQGAAAWCRHVGRLAAQEQASNDWSERFRATARELTVDRIRECRHLEDLERIDQWLREARYRDWTGELARCWSRRELGELIVETGNRLTLLRMGRLLPRERGERFDLARIPDDRLDVLIQRHPNLELVEQLRAEKLRRFVKSC